MKKGHRAKLPTKKFILDALSNELWDRGNRVLYELCRKHPNHNNAGFITAKVWLIGRAYAAAIERGAGQNRGDELFLQLAESARKLKIDRGLKRLSKRGKVKIDIPLAIHFEFMSWFHAVSTKNKRSLASKYLHFHFPKRFYLYDTRAVIAIRRLTDPVKKLRKNFPETYDREYASFCLRCENLSREITQRYNIKLSKREFDNVLLTWFAKNE